MATLGEILAHRHGVAEAAASLRYYNDTMACLEKMAQSKEAGVFSLGKNVGSALGQAAKRVGENIGYYIKNLGRATQVANELEQAQIEIGHALRSHFEKTLPHPGIDATPKELEGWAKRVHSYVAQPATLETIEKQYNPQSKAFEPKSSKMVPVPSSGASALKAMGEVQKNLEPRRGGINTAIGILGAGGLAGGAFKQKFFHGHRKNLDSILTDPQIPKTHHARAKDVFGVLARYAPSIAADPVVSKDFTKNLIRHETIDHHTVKTLMDAEKVYHEVNGRRAQFYDTLGQLAGNPGRGRR